MGQSDETEQAVTPAGEPKPSHVPVKWYRSTFYNMTVLGLCNFSAPGIWGAMNSLGAGGAASPHLVNSSNAISFCLMILSCYFSGVLVHYVGIKGALIYGTLGFAPYAAGLYTNNRFGTEWFFIFGACLCGMTSGCFWMSEAAVAIAYPEPEVQGKAVGYWLSYRLSGQILGGAINLGINAKNNHAGKVSYHVYQVFIALQCLGPVFGLFLSKPEQVERTDGRKVRLSIPDNPWIELKRTALAFFRPQFLLIVLFIGQTVFPEAVYNTYLASWFTVRARALGSFLSGIVAVIAGNIFGYFLDYKKISVKNKARYGFISICVIHGAWWLWATVMVTRYNKTMPTYDWSDKGFGAGFGVFVLLTTSFQLNYMFLYFVIHNLAESHEEIIRFAALLRGTESAWQAVSYGLTSIPLFAHVGGVYFNFVLWFVSLAPAWVVMRRLGVDLKPPVDPLSDVELSGTENLDHPGAISKAPALDSTLAQDTDKT